MSLQFIIGGSGSGKTRRLYEDLIRQSLEEPEGRFFAIVPEQFTMQTQKEIVTLHPRHGVMNIDIVSFERLAYRIFEELSVETLAVLDDMGKSMVLRRVAAEIRGELGYFGRHLDKAGFIGELKSMLSEFFQYGITPQRLEELAAGAASPLLKQKLKDLLALYRAFQDYTENRVTVKEEILSLLCRVLPDSALIRGSVVTLDGYTGFTPVQYQLLEILLGCCRKVTVTVTMDPRDNPYREGGEQHLFALSRRTVCRLIDRAAAAGARREKDILLETRPYWRFKESPELQFIESELFRYRGKAYKTGALAGEKAADDAAGEKETGGSGPAGEGKAGDPAPRESLRLLQAASPQEEVRFLCGEISRLIRQEGFRYRDIAVITGDLESYGREIVRQFGESGIPCFIDYKKNILSNPMVELCRAALEVLESGFSYEAVFRYLKTGLVLPLPEAPEGYGEPETLAGAEAEQDTPADAEAGQDIPADEAAAWDFPTPEGAVQERPHTQQELLFLLENYVLALGIRGFKRWSTPWAAVYRGAELLNLAELNRFREAVLAPFLPLREVFSRRGATVEERTRALVDFLETLEIERKLREMEEQFLAAGQESLAREYGQVYGLVMDLFDRITALLGEEKTGRREYMDILNAGFSEIRVGLIPAVVDRVVVGDITRSRLSHIRALFFVGVNDGLVPAAAGRGGILSEAERRRLKEQQAELAPTAREEGFLQRFYLYLALTKPSDFLYLTCAAASAEGKALRPSGLMNQLLKLFPDKRLEAVREEELFAWSPSLGMDRVLTGLREYGEQGASPEFLWLYRYFCRSGVYGEEMRRLTEAASWSYDKKGIGRTAARELYGPVLNGSVTRMELYASCAYAHFLAYGLELKERRVYELEAADIGNLFHGAIDAYFKRMKEENRSFRTISEEDRRRLVAESVAQVAADYGNTIMKSSSRNAYLERKVCRIADRTVWALTEQLKKGDFEPAGFEVSFSPADHLRAMRIPLSRDEAIQLRGRIDRIDLCEDGDLLYLKIIDYKTGKTKFDLTDIYYGLQLQLVVYMDAALEKVGRQYPDRRVVPAGLFYYNIDDPMVEREGGGDEGQTEAEILKKLRMNGLVNGSWEALGHLDQRLSGAEGAVDSQVIPVSVKNDAIVERRSSVAGEERFRVLGDFVNRKLRSMGREILDGSIAAAPYKSGNRTACDYCPYHSVCGFDLKTEGYGYRRFDSLSPEEIWERMAETGGEGENRGRMAESGAAEEKEKEAGNHGGKVDQGSAAGH